MGIGPYLVGVAFWMFLAAAAVAGIVGSYKRRRIELEPLRSAIEHGQQLDPAIIEKLMAQPEHEQKQIEPLHLRIGSIIPSVRGCGGSPSTPGCSIYAARRQRPDRWSRRGGLRPSRPQAAAWAHGWIWTPRSRVCRTMYDCASCSPTARA
jgi:hypothetical protein